MTKDSNQELTVKAEKVASAIKIIMNSVNIVLTGKGGVGKSFATQCASQYFLHDKKIPTNVGDCDPVNNSTSRVKGLNAEYIEIMQNNTIMQGMIDQIIQSIVENENETFFIDTGSSTYIPLMKYIHDNDLIEFFDSLDRPVYLHALIVAGQELPDTLAGFQSLCEMVKGTNVKVVAWVNEVQGKPIVTVKDKRVPLVESGYFDKFSDSLGGVVILENRNSDAFETDLSHLTENNLTLEEAKVSPDFNVMQKARLNKVFKSIYEQLDAIYTY